MDIDDICINLKTNSKKIDDEIDFFLKLYNKLWETKNVNCIRFMARIKNRCRMVV
jgi:hypothetical protein